MKLQDIITVDELEQELFAKVTSETTAQINAKCDAQMTQWKPYCDMLYQRCQLGDISRFHFDCFSVIIAAIANVLADREKRQVH